MTITIGLIAINVIVFFVLEILGDTESAAFMLEHGGIYPVSITEKKEYWRFLTAMFLQFGFGHLLNNMVMLGAAGRILEEALGKVKYFLLYILAGLGGGILSYLQMIKSGEYAVAAGASGAIFGIVGALCWIVLIHKGKYETLTGKGLLVMIALCLYYGVSTASVDNWGHIGGLVAGFVICIIFYQRKPKKIDFSEQNLYT